jgi:cobalt-zinc-cadmium efflux system outer membrane protein
LKMEFCSRYAKHCVPLLAAAVLSACAGRLPYQAAGLEQKTAPEQFQERDADDASLADLVRATGYDGQWPPSQWHLETLTLLGLYFNPQIDVARAQALASQAALATAARRSPLSLELAAEHHSREVDDTPWTLGFAIGLPIGEGSRRQARVQKATSMADAAQVEIAASMWRVRGSVRNAVIDLIASSRRARLLEQRLQTHRELVQLLQRRVDAGMASARELGRERTALDSVKAQLALEHTTQAGAYGDLAGALGLPLDTVRSLTIADDAVKQPGTVAGAAEARGDALRNRLDIYVSLLEFGAADAEVRLAVANQYPVVRLTPGFLWDQGDQIWSLGTLLIPPASAQEAVREAEARREVAARRFTALQLTAISQVEQAREVLVASSASVDAARDTEASARAQFERIRRYFEAGGGDRLQLVTAQLEMVQARQHLVDAQIATLVAAARFEDAMQLPVLSEYTKLPDRQAGAGQSS